MEVSAVSVRTVAGVAQERAVALPWLTGLRWMAVAGQVWATVLAVGLGLRLPVGWIAGVIAVTAASNAGVQWWAWRGRRVVPRWVTPGIVMQDVILLTVLLYLTGGSENPFAILYVVHVAVAVVALRGEWAWRIAGVSGLAYGAVFLWRRPLDPDGVLPEWALALGRWGSVVLVMSLIAYFIGRVMMALREREQQLVEVQARASRSERLAALTTLAAGAAHELGSPLGTIAVVAKEMEIEARKDGGGGVVEEDARLIRQEVERCRGILERMRVDVIEDAGEGSPGARLGEIMDELKGDLKNGEVERLKVDSLVSAQYEVARARVVRRAVGVLLRNAFDASPAEAKVALRVRRGAGWVVFEVEDRGAGMSEEEVRRAGEPFFTTKGPGRGMGLGLFLVRLAADTYGGKFHLESKLGEGTRAVLELPEQ